MLRFKLFDGVNTFTAVENEPLDIELISDFALAVLHPGIEIRRGVCMLMNAKFEIIYNALSTI